MKKILVADDNANIRKVVKMEFESLGHRVLTAADGRQALEVVDQEHPDLIILDVMMPEMNGHDVCYELKRDPRHRHIPIVLLTAKSMEEDKYWGREVGADEYITKPFDPEELEQVVERIFAMKAKGESYHPLTKLPLWTAIENEMKGRRERGEKFAVLSCFLDPEAFDTFQKKYGNVSADKVLLQTSHQIQAEVREVAGEKGFVGQTGDNVFYLIAPPEQMERIRGRVTEELAAIIPFQYAEEDAERGYVLTSTLSGAEKRLPLMTLTWKELEEG